jgi:hypothetical protein
MQLVQPVLTLVWAGLLLGERLSAGTLLGGVAVIACAGLAVRVRAAPAPTPGGRAGRNTTGGFPGGRRARSVRDEREAP